MARARSRRAGAVPTTVTAHSMVGLSSEVKFIIPHTSIIAPAVEFAQSAADSSLLHHYEFMLATSHFDAAPGAVPGSAKSLGLVLLNHRTQRKFEAPNRRKLEMPITKSLHKPRWSFRVNSDRTAGLREESD